MKTLYLIRHAKSSWKYDELSDHERPLNKRGKRDAPEMGNRLKHMDIKPDLLVSSKAKRTLKTAKIIAEETNYPKEQIIATDELYLASKNEILDIVRKQNDSKDALFVFAHNPGITDLACHLSDTTIENVPTCGVVALQFDVKRWQEISPKKGELLFFDYPKKTA